MTDRSPADVLRDHTDRLLALPGVEGVAEGENEGRPCIRILVRDAAAATGLDLPTHLEGCPVLVEVSGSFRSR